MKVMKETSKKALTAIDNMLMVVQTPIPANDGCGMCEADPTNASACSAQDQSLSSSGTGEVGRTEPTGSSDVAVSSWQPGVSDKTGEPRAPGISDEVGNPRAPTDEDHRAEDNSYDINTVDDMSLFDEIGNDADECGIFISELNFRLYRRMEQELERQWQDRIKNIEEELELQKQELNKQRQEMNKQRQEMELQKQELNKQIEEKTTALKKEIQKEAKGYEVFQRYTNIAKILLDIVKIWLDLHKP